jgi:lipopolysaccharide cholinephosphotransferase
VARRGEFDTRRRAGVIVWGYHEVVPQRCYEVPSTVWFEGRQCPAPADPATVLRILYGDYLQLPPVDERVSRHRFVGYLREPAALDPPATPD